MSVAGVRRFSLPILEYLKRPAFPLQKIEDEPESTLLPSVPEITESEIRDALNREVSAHCCYGRAPARDMEILDIKHNVAYHYVLETFTERRATSWIEEPFTGGAVDRQDMGEPPDVDDIPATPSEFFKSYVYHQEIPYTAEISTCEDCDGEGKYECPTCLGQGWEFCPYCRGNKWNPLYTDSYEGECFKCQDSGERTCWECNGDEEVSCKNCKGAGEMKSYIRLYVIWYNHIDDYVVEKGSALKAQRLRCVTGKVAVEEEGLSVLPLSHFPISAVCMASVQLIKHHAIEYKDEKVLKQRQRVSIIPTAAVTYKWNNHEGVFYVYGYERCVHVPDYPQKYCCGCSIM